MLVCRALVLLGSEILRVVKRRNDGGDNNAATNQTKPATDFAAGRRRRRHGVRRSNFSWAADGKILNIRVRNEYHSFDPLITISETDTVVMHALFERLVEYNSGDTWGWHLGAAEMIEYETPTRLRVRLRPGITWSGGYGDVSVEDFKYSIERIAFTETATNRMEWTQLIEVGVDGPQDGVIIMKAPQSNLFSNTLPRDMATIVCKEAMEEIGGKFTFDPPAWSGPYKIGEFSPPRVPWCSFATRSIRRTPARPARKALTRCIGTSCVSRMSQATNQPSSLTWRVTSMRPTSPRARFPSSRKTYRRIPNW